MIKILNNHDITLITIIKIEYYIFRELETRPIEKLAQHMTMTHKKG